MPHPSRKATLIEIRYDDGTIERAEGLAAAEILSWWQSSEILNCIHGAQYKGPQFQIVRPANANEEKPDA